jgi:hypothetical protein
VWRSSPEFAPPPRPWVSPSTALTVIGPDAGLTLSASNWYHQSQQSHLNRQQGSGYTPSLQDA